MFAVMHANAEHDERACVLIISTWQFAYTEQELAIQGNDSATDDPKTQISVESPITMRHVLCAACTEWLGVPAYHLTQSAQLV